MNKMRPTRIMKNFLKCVMAAGAVTLFVMVAPARGHGDHGEHVTREKLPNDPVQLNNKIRDVWDSYKDNKYLDRDHLHEHIGDMFTMQQENQLSSEEMAFYFHGLHDFNNDDSLDGLELMYALQHSLSHRNPEFEKVSLEQIAPLVDSELHLMDRDLNGMISYGELRQHLKLVAQQNPQMTGGWQ